MAYKAQVATTPNHSLPASKPETYYVVIEPSNDTTYITSPDARQTHDVHHRWFFDADNDQRYHNPPRHPCSKNTWVPPSVQSYRASTSDRGLYYWTLPHLTYHTTTRFDRSLTDVLVKRRLRHKQPPTPIHCNRMGRLPTIPHTITTQYGALLEAPLQISMLQSTSPF